MLLAQAAPDAAASSTMLFPVLAIVCVSVGVCVTFLVLLFRHLRTVRQLTHTERMRSLEAGFPLEVGQETKAQAKYMHNAFWIAFWLVFSVPAAALSAASTATARFNGSALLLSIIWSGAAAASIAAVACATALMINTRPQKPEEVETWGKTKKIA